MVPADSSAPAALPTELQALLDLGCAVAVAVKAKIASGGKFGIADLSTVMVLVPQISPAFSNIQAVPAEIESLGLVGAEQVVSYVVSKVGIVDAKTINVLNAGVSIAASVYGLIVALKPAPVVAAAPVAAPAV